MTNNDLHVADIDPMDRELSIAELEGVAGGGFWDVFRNELKSIINWAERHRFPYEPPVPIRLK